MPLKPSTYVLIFCSAIGLPLPSLAADANNSAKSSKHDVADNVNSENAGTEKDLLEYSLEELLDMTVVSASKTAEKISDIPASITLITREEIERLGYQSLAEVIHNTSGVFNIDNYNRIAASFGIRGAWNPRAINASIAVLVNGINQVRDDRASNPFEKITVPIEAIDRIEIIRGPMSVIYGNGASFGAINIITNQENTNVASASAGSLDGYRRTVNYGYKNDKGSIELIASQWGDDGVDHKFEDMTDATNLAFLETVANMPKGYRTKNLLEHDNKYFSLHATYNNFYLDASQNESDSELFIVVPALDEGSIRKSKNTSYTLGYNNQFYDNWFVNAHFTYNDYRADSLFEGFVPNAKIGSNYTKYKSREFELLSNYHFSENLNWLVGIHHREMTEHQQYSDVPPIGIYGALNDLKERNVDSIYSQINYKFLDDYQLTVGFRHERVPTHDMTVSTFFGYENENSASFKIDQIINNTPRIALLYNVNDKHLLKFMYGEASKIGQDNFAPEATQTFELNHTYTAECFSISTSLYETQIDNLVIRDRLVDENGMVSSIDSANGKSTGKGIETNLKIRWNKFSSQLSASYQSSRNNQNIDAAYSPNLLLHGQLSYEFNTNHHLAILFKYVDSMQPYYDPVAQARIGDEIDGYATLDLNLRFNNLFDTGMYLNGKISNVLDEEIRYPNSPENNGFLTKGTIGAERGFSLTVGLKF